MRTLVAAADPPPRRPVDEYSLTTGNSSTSTTVDTVVAWLSSAGLTVTPWQAVVISEAYRPDDQRSCAVASLAPNASKSSARSPSSAGS
jgi:hypothetical protein